VIFAEERVKDVVEEYYQIGLKHWMETDLYEQGQVFNPDVSRYIKSNEIGIYHLFTAREEGKLVGDIGAYITPSMHTQKTIAQEDTWYLLPEYRKGRNAILFLRFAEDKLKEYGVEEIYTTTKTNRPTGKLMEYLGYKQIATQYHKEL
jgi:hypothetical protein